MGKKMKGILSSLFKFKFKSKTTHKSKVRNPVDILQRVRDHLITLYNEIHDHHGSVSQVKIEEFGRLLAELKFILFGSNECEPNPEACAQLTQEFFKENTLRLLILCLPELDLEVNLHYFDEARKDATQVVANLQRQQVQFRLIACDYLEENTDLLDLLVSGYETHKIALHYGNMLRECIRHQSIAKYVLESHTQKFFNYMQLPDFDVSSDAVATFKELLTRHKSTVADYLSKNYDWFFEEFNTKLLESKVYITRRQAIKLLGEILLDRSNAGITARYVSSTVNLKILMNLLRDESKPIQLEAFNVFKQFVDNRNKPVDVIGILITNRNKLLRLIGNLKIDKEDGQFEADKALVIREIAELDLDPREILSIK